VQTRTDLLVEIRVTLAPMSPSEPSLEDRLDDLQRESELRRRELREIAAELPAAVSRRAMLRAMARDFGRAPGKGDVFRRAATKAAKAPRQLYLTVRYRVRDDSR
jgi:hypothetical protein